MRQRQLVVFARGKAGKISETTWKEFSRLDNDFLTQWNLGVEPFSPLSITSLS